MLLITAGCSGRLRTVSLEMAATSDIHGYFFPYDFVSDSGTDSVPGSLARVRTWLSEERSRLSDRLLLFDIGDLLQGTPVTYFDKITNFGFTSYPAGYMNELGYNAATIGNHDLEAGLTELEKELRTCGYPLLCANLFYSGTDRTFLKPYAILNTGGLKIAVVGMTTPYASFKIPPSCIDAYSFRGIAETASELIPYIQQNEHPHLIVGLFHSGLEGGMTDGRYLENETMSVATSVPGFDVIFYGHDHIAACRKVACVDGDSVLLVNPGAYAGNVALVNLQVTMRSDSIVSCDIKGSLLSMDGVEPDKSFLKAHDKDIRAIRTFQDSVIGAVDADINCMDAAFGPSAATGILSDLMMGSGSAEITISSTYDKNLLIPAGKVTMRDMYRFYPYENNVTYMNLKGSEIVSVIEYFSGLWVNTIRQDTDTLLKVVRTDNGYDLENRLFDFMTAGGIDYTIDVTKPVGSRVTVLSKSDGTPFSEDEYYRTGISSFLACGGYAPFNEAVGLSGYELRERELFSTSADYRYSLITKLALEAETGDSLHVAKPGNWKFIPEDLVQKAFMRDRKLLEGIPER